MAKTIKQRDLNLLLALDKSRAKPARHRRYFLVIAVLALVLLILAAGGAFYLLRIGEMVDERETLSNYINDPARQSDLAAANALSNESAAIKNRVDALTQFLGNESSYPDLSGEQLMQALALTDAQINITHVDYDKRSGVLILTGVSSTTTRISLYATGLHNSGIFSEISYEGYSGGTYTKTGDPQLNPDGTITIPQYIFTEYRFSLSCRLTPPATANPGDAGQAEPAAGNGEVASDGNE
jgi:Tfp pilus assembly protein PilN